MTKLTRHATTFSQSKPFRLDRGRSCRLCTGRAFGRNARKGQWRYGIKGDYVSHPFGYRHQDLGMEG